MDKPFSKKIVVVTGASSGIGQAIALLFAAQGAELVVHGNQNLTGLFHTAQQVMTAGSRPLCITSDFRQSESALGIVQAAFQRHGNVDVWVNAAGADVLTGKQQGSSFDEKLAYLWQIDVHATLLICRYAAARMADQQNRADLPVILNIGWDQAQEGMEGDSGQLFSAIKAAVAAFSKSLAKTYGPRLRVNCIAPGWTQTLWGNQASDAWNLRARGESCLARWGSPNDIAQAAVWLASPAASFINGQTISVNGGWKPNY